MRYYDAKQRQNDMKWDYVCGNRAVGYCGGYHEFTEKDSYFSEALRNKENARMLLNKDKYHDCGHETEEGARECYKQYLLDNLTRLYPKQENPTQLNKCKICDEFCSGYATVGEYSMYNLCEKHCNREDLEKIMSSPGQMWIS